MNTIYVVTGLLFDNLNVNKVLYQHHNLFIK